MKQAGRPRTTFEEQNVLIKKLRDRIDRLEKRLENVKIHKTPEYFFSFTGYYIIQKWIYFNGLSKRHAEILVILSYYEVFTRTDCKQWIMLNHHYKKAMNELIEMGYVVKIEVPTKARVQKAAYALTQKGKDFEADYEKYYNERIEELINKGYTDIPNNRLRFRDGQYFRREKITRYERRAAQGGGMLPTQIPKTQQWRNVEVKNEQTRHE